MVVGAGAFGAGAALELARRGHDVTLLDSGPIPHPEAASTDISKIVRTDYGADAFYAELAHEAIRGWERWNADLRTPLYHDDGFLLLAAGPMVPGGFEHESHAIAVAAGRAVERLDPAAHGRRFPAWRADALRDGYLSRTAGWAESGRAVSWLAERCRDAGVEIVEDRAVEVGGAVPVVRTAGGRRLDADRVVVAAGARTPGLVPELADRMRPTGQVVLHFRVDPDAFAPSRFPPWAWDIAGTGMYGFPALPDGTLKVARHGRGLPLSPTGAWELPADVVDREEARFRDFFARALPAAADAPLIAARLCAYCDTFDGDFWIDRHPADPGLVVAAGGSGHGFKFAPVIGGIIADVAEGAPARDRFRWRDAGPPRTEHARAAD